MPDRRLPPVRLNLAPRGKKRPGGAKPKSPRRPRKTRSGGESSSAPYWIAAGLIVLLLVIGAVYYETPAIQGWFVNREARSLPEEPLPEKPAPVVKPKPLVSAKQAEEDRLKKLKEKAAEETRLLVERTPPRPLPVPAPTPVTPKPAPPVVPPPPVTPAPSAQTPPLVQPVPFNPKPGAPARALPVDMNKLDTERIAAYQVALERIHFSCGFIDGDQGMRTQRMVRAFQSSRGLPITGFLDPATRSPRLD